MEKFELDFDRDTVAITVVALILLSIFGVYCLLSGIRETLIFSFLSILVFLLFLMMPTSVEVSSEFIKVNRVLGSVKCPISKNVEILEELGWGLLVGTAGLFGWYGVYTIKGETALVYSRKNRKLVLVRAKRNYVFGVKNPEKFVQCLQNLNILKKGTVGR